jgi:hypothetical protein
VDNTFQIQRDGLKLALHENVTAVIAKAREEAAVPSPTPPSSSLRLKHCRVSADVRSHTQFAMERLVTKSKAPS